MNPERVLVIQTAFLGDMILTLPLIQELKKHSKSETDVLCIPETSELLKNNIYVNEIISYDKRNSGLKGFTDLISKLRKKKYDLIISPHRSFRSSLISYLAGAKRTISFDNSSLGFLYDERIGYDKDVHEIIRDLRLLGSEGIKRSEIIKPEIFTSAEDKRKIDCLFYEHRINSGDKFIVIAPGTVWFTKRFPEKKFAVLCDLIEKQGRKIFLIGSRKDKKISDFIVNNSKNRSIINVSGCLTILESAELISRAKLLISNDSAPLHIANAVHTDVIAIYGATIPSFGFYPYGKNDVIIETNGLKCRPCSIHGGNKCPIGTFECMMSISEKEISDAVNKLLSQEIL